jgi:hypothetical protein
MFGSMRRHYWSCSKFANWIRSFVGDEKPFAATFEEWDTYHTKCNPVVSWITNNLFDGVQNVIYFPYDLFWEGWYLFNAKFIDKYSYLDTGLSSWKYHEIDTRILHANFNTLAKFIEVEAAHMYIICNKHTELKGANAGIAWLDFQADSESRDENSNEVFKEIKRLYYWWVTRATRMSPHEIYPRDYEKIWALYKERDEEDTGMLCRLMYVRQYLWT